MRTFSISLKEMYPFAKSESSSQVIIMYSMAKFNAPFISYKIVIMTAETRQSKCCKVHLTGSFSLLLYSRYWVFKVHSFFGNSLQRCSHLLVASENNNIYTRPFTIIWGMSTCTMYNDHFPTTTRRVHIIKKNVHHELRIEIKTD